MLTFSPTLLLKAIKINKVSGYQIKQIKNQLPKVTSRVFKSHYWNYRRFTDESQTTTDVSKTITDDYRRLTENYRRIIDEPQTSHRRVTENYRPTSDRRVINESQTSTNESQISQKRITDNYKQVTDESPTSHRRLQRNAYGAPIIIGSMNYRVVFSAIDMV